MIKTKEETSPEPVKTQIDDDNEKNESLFKKCSFCSYESVTLSKCKYCDKFFCKDHLEPKKPSDFLRTKGGHSCKEFTEIQKSQPQTEKTVESEKEDIPQMTIETKKIVTKNYSLKLIGALTIIIILLIAASFEGYSILNNKYSNLTDEKHFFENSLVSTNFDIKNTRVNYDLENGILEDINTNLRDNISKINLLKAGDKFHLHNPLYIDAKQFIASDTSINLIQEIDNARQQGIYCAYVIIRTVTPGTEYGLIGFNTTDRGMMYYVAVTDNQVVPFIGAKYVNCVIGIPYYSTDNDTITGVFPIW